MRVISSATPYLAIVKQEDRIVLSACYRNDFGTIMLIRVEGIDLAWNRDHLGIVFRTVGRDSTLPIPVQTPCPYCPICADSKGMVLSSGNIVDVSQAQSLRLETIDFAPLDDTSSELVLLTISPCVDVPGGSERENVVGSARD